MRIWNYRPSTGELIGEGVADPNPVEEGEWIVPAYATTISPGTPQPGFVWQWDGSTWRSTRDCRGQTWWKADAEFNTEPVVIDFIGEPQVHGFTKIEPAAPPIVVLPILVSPRQIRLALTKLGWRMAFESYVISAGQDVIDTWQFASKFERDGMVNIVAEAIGKTTEEIDVLFEVAKTL